MSEFSEVQSQYVDVEAAEPIDESEIIIAAPKGESDAPGRFSWNPLDWYKEFKQEFEEFTWTFDEKKRVLIRAVLGEGLVTYLFLFIVMATAVNNGRQEQPENLVLGAISTAFASVALIYSFADVSGAHFNPAVTFGCIITGKTSIKKGLLYIGIQLLAAIFATLSLMAVFPRPKDGFFKDIPSSVVVSLDGSAHIVNAFFMEVALTFILVYVIFATAFDTVDTSNSIKVNGKASKDKGVGKHLTIYTTAGNTKAGFAPLAIGFTLGFLCFVGGTVSGGAFNPARVFGPALITGQFRHHWIYWFGDFIGAALAGWTQSFFAHEAVQHSHSIATKQGGQN
ncbi:aquaporin-like protein [Chytridium lagenaria]|nr:aquaporin-like protein [Chytridium lagenaria]